MTTPQKPWRLSASAMQVWSECPLAWSMKYELGVPEPGTDPLKTGQLMAYALEAYLKHLFEQKVPTDITALPEIARRQYEIHGAGLPITALDAVLRIAERYAQTHVLDLEHLYGVEVWLPLDGQHVELAGREIVGKLDELYLDDEGTSAHVIDAKTNWYVWSEEEARATLQARVYPFLVTRAFPDVEEVEVTFDFVRWGVERSLHFTRADIEMEAANLESLARAMQRPGPRPANPGHRCGYCPYTEQCAAFKSAKANGTILAPTAESEAKKLGEDLAVLEAGLARRRAALREWAKGNGPVRVNGMSIGYFVTETPTLDVRLFAVWCEEQGVDPFDYLAIPTTELRKLLHRNPELEGLAGTEKSTRFDTKRAGGEESAA